jgi:hypothetical protein
MRLLSKIIRKNQRKKLRRFAYPTRRVGFSEPQVGDLRSDSVEVLPFRQGEEEARFSAGR